MRVRMPFAGIIVLTFLFATAAHAALSPQGPASLGQIGLDDFRISSIGTDADGSEVSYPAVAYNSDDHEFFVVWAGYDGQHEVWGQRIDAATGAEIGSDIRLSDMGGETAGYSVNNPDVVYNATSNEYLVVWRGDDDVAPLVDDDWEIFGQRVDAVTGAEIGGDFRISFMGPDGETSVPCDNPAVAWDSVNNRYLVVWQGMSSDVASGEQEIWARLLDSTGSSLSADDVRVSHVGPDADTSRYAFEPDVAFDPVNEEYLVVWYADDAADNALDVYAHFVTAAGAESGDDFRVSDMGDTDSDTLFGAFAPKVAFNAATEEYLVVWAGDDNSVGDDETEIWGQLIQSVTGLESGTNDFVISSMGPEDSVDQGGFAPDVAVNPLSREYFVVWHGDAVTNNEQEIWAQILSPSGDELGSEFALSDLGPSGDTSYLQLYPAVAFAGGTGLIVWRGDDELVAAGHEVEVYGQLYEGVTAVTSSTFDDFEVAQGPEDGPLTLGAGVLGTVTDHDADDPSIHGGERNLRISGNNAGGDDITLQVVGGNLVFNRTASSSGEIAFWWDGDGDSGNFNALSSQPYDLTSGGTRDRFRIAVTSSSSTTDFLRMYVYSSGSNVSKCEDFTLPAGAESFDIPFTAFTTTSGLGATFSSVRAVYISTLSNTGAWSASIAGITLPLPPSEATSLISAAPASATADGVSSSTITVQLKDAGGNDIISGGNSVALSTTLGTLSSVSDNGDGTYTATLTSVTAGTATVTGTLDGDAITDDAEVAFVPGPADGTTTTITTNSSSIEANGSSTATITVQAFDANGNELVESGGIVALETSLGTLGAVTDNGDGSYTATLTSGIVVGTATITGTIDGDPITDDATVSFTPGAATTLLVEAPATAAGGLEFSVTVTARDANGNTATGYTGTVRITSTASSSTLPADHAYVTGDAGVHTFNVILNSAGNITVTAKDTATGSITGTDVVAVEGDTSIGLTSSANPSLVGQSVTFTATVTSTTTGTISGSVAFQEGATTLGSAALSGGVATFTTSALSAGAHEITAVYAGSSTFNGSTSDPVSQTVNLTAFGAPALVVATATSTSQVSVSWTAVADATMYQVWRSSLGGAFALRASVSAPATAFTDNGLTASTTYLYQVRAIGLPGTSAFSATDAATTIIFTDPTLTTSVKIKAVHVTELRTAVNAMRAAGGLGAATFADDPLTDGSTGIKGVHVTELRTALDQARDAIDVSVLSYTDPTISTTTTAKAAHFAELRAGVQ